MIAGLSRNDCGKRRRQTPGATRPARPARCMAEAREARRRRSESVLVAASKNGSFEAEVDHDRDVGHLVGEMEGWVGGCGGKGEREEKKVAAKAEGGRSRG